MSITIFIFTLIIAFVVYRLICKEQYLSKNKPLWKNLIYWGVVLFISIIFNMVIYADTTFALEMSYYLNSQTIEMLITLVLSCLIIQLISPSIFLRKAINSTKEALKKLKQSKNAKRDINSEEIVNIKDIPSSEKPSVFLVKNNESHYNNTKELQEKDFELLLNILCWLSFSFVIFIEIFFVITSWIYGVDPVGSSAYDQLSKNMSIHHQLRDISNIILFFTLPISIRQILYYLAKLRKFTEAPNKEELNSVQFEKYTLIQKHLNGVHKKL
ncbi:hypothetical protein [Brassicibacter mesophilus]|uniref:hypothetical protein n=1 Tax=Brassicibacter mesophilus TaxID=745119 RepID=UPI003D1E1BF9